MTKKEIRMMMRGRERSFPVDPDLYEGIWERVASLEGFISARTVLIYMDMPGEVPTDGFIAKWKGSKRFVIPRVEGNDLALFEYDPSALQEGYRGIREPSAGAAGVDPSEVDLALVPGVAFTFSEGRLFRLGHGKGFYDRLLGRMHCPKVGIFQPFRLVDSLPLDPWDQPLDMSALPGEKGRD